MTEEANPGATAEPADDRTAADGTDAANSKYALTREDENPLPKARQAILNAVDRKASIRAVTLYAVGRMIVHYLTRSQSDLVREAVANEAWSCVRRSPARNDVRPHDVCAIVDRAYQVGRKASAG